MKVINDIIKFGLICAGAIALNNRTFKEIFGATEKEINKFLGLLSEAGLIMKDSETKTGFKLARAASKITFGEIVKLFEDLLPSISTPVEPLINEIDGRIKVDFFPEIGFGKILGNTGEQEILYASTLQDLIDSKKK